MARRLDLPDRDGKSKLMKQRSIRLTDEENYMIELLLKKTGLSLRDLIVMLVDKELA